MKPRIFINLHYLEIGGAERALLGLLNAFDAERVDVDLFLNQHTGEFMHLIPKHVNLLAENALYSSIERPIKDIVFEGHVGIAARRLVARRKAARYFSSLPPEQKAIDSSVFQYVYSEVEPGLPKINPDVEYDLAISFLNPHNFVLTKVKAKKKVCWIHTDYSTIHINRDMELPIWGGYDHIASISPECTKAFLTTFPELKDKMIEVENILSPAFVRDQACEFTPTDEMPDIPGETKVLSIGRFSYPKRFDEVPRMCRIMLDRGAKFKWYIIGYGDASAIRAAIDKYDVADTMILLGKKTNPYPYIARCDIYAQPSRYEGKSVTVREAQILGKSVAITNYPTAASQVRDGVDGHILPFNTDEAAVALSDFIADKEAIDRIRTSMADINFGNESEVNKLYSLIGI